MLTNAKRITVEAKCAVDDKEIKGFRAVIVSGSEDVSFHHWDIDKAAVKEYRQTVRADQAEFEDYAYKLQETFAAVQE